MNPSENTPHPLETLLKRSWQITDFRLVGKYEVHPDGKWATFKELRSMSGELLYFPEDKNTGLRSRIASASVIPNDKLITGEYYQFIAKLNSKESELGRNPLFVVPQPFGKVSQQVQERIQKEQLVKSIFRRNGATPFDAKNLANSLKNFQIELYTKTERFIFELLQNADDFPLQGKEVSISFEVLKENILVQHNGRPFSQRDVESICSVGDSSKAKDISATGYKGIGFKSVFTHAKRVFVSSGGFEFCFNKEHSTYSHFEKMFPDFRENFSGDKEVHTGPNNVPWQLKPIWREKDLFPQEVRHHADFFNENVSFCLEFGTRNCEAFTEKADTFFSDPRFLLFLRNISQINYVTGDSTLLVKRYVESGKTRLLSGNTEQQYITHKADKIDFSNSIKTFKNAGDIPPKLLDFPFLTLSFAALIEQEEIVPLSDVPLFTYLPTEDRSYHFPFLVNGDFVTTSNREQILPGNKWNELVFEQIGYQVFIWVQSIVKISEYRKNAYRLIPKKLSQDTAVCNAFNLGFERAISDVDFILNRSGSLQLLKNTLIDKTGLTELLGDDFSSITGYDEQVINADVHSKKIENLIREYNEGIIFDLDDLNDLLDVSTFKAWLTVPEHNAVFINHLADKQWIERLAEQPVFLNQNLQLCTAGQLYDSFSDDLSLLEWLNVSYLHPEVAESISSITLPIKSYNAENFIKVEVLGNQSTIDELLKDKQHNLNFYRYIFKHHESLSDKDFFGSGKLNYFRVWSGLENDISSFSDNIYGFHRSIAELINKQALPAEQINLLSPEFHKNEEDVHKWAKFWQRLGVKEYKESTVAGFLTAEVVSQAMALEKHFDAYDPFDEDVEPTDSYLQKQQASATLWVFISQALKHIPEETAKKLCKDIGSLVVFTTENCTTKPLRECYLSNSFTGNPTLEQLADQFADIDSYFISGSYLDNKDLSVIEWRKLFEQCGAQTTTENFVERLSAELDNIEETNLLTTTRFLFENRSFFQSSDKRLNSLKIQITDEFVEPAAAVIGSYYTQDSLLETVLPSIRLKNLVSENYASRRLADWTVFFEKIGVVILKTEQEVIDYKIDYLLSNQEALHTLENTVEIINELASLHRQDKLKDHYQSLGQLKLKLKGHDNNFLQADECHLSTEYKPKLDLETLLPPEECPDLFVNPIYIGSNRDHVRSFFLKIGVYSDFEILEDEWVVRSNLTQAYQSAIDTQHPYIPENAKKFAGQHRIGPWIRLNYERFLNRPTVLVAFWAKVLESKKFRDHLFSKIKYKCQYYSFSCVNNIAFRSQTERLIPTLDNQIVKANELYSISLKDKIDDLALLPAVDLTGVSVDGTNFEQWLGIRQNLSLSLCLKRISKVNNQAQLNSEGTWQRVKEILKAEKKNLNGEDKASLINFKTNGFLPNQTGEWKQTSNLFYISDDFDLGIGNSPWLIADELQFIASWLELKKLTETDFAPEFRNPIIERSFQETLTKRLKFIAFAEKQSDWSECQSDYLDTITAYQFYRTVRISFCYTGVTPPIENTDRNFYQEDNKVYYIGNWNGSRAAELFSFVHKVLDLKKVSVKVLQDILLNTEAEIIELLEEKNFSIPDEWKHKRELMPTIAPPLIADSFLNRISQSEPLVSENDEKTEQERAQAQGPSSEERVLDSEEVENDFIKEVEEFISAELEDTEWADYIPELKNILELSIDQPKEKQKLYNLIAKIKLAKSTLIHFDRADKDYNRLVDGDEKYFIHSARGSFAYIHPNEILSMRDNGYKIALDFGSKFPIKIYHKAEDILSLNTNHLLAYQYEKTMDDLFMFCEHNKDANKHLLIVDKDISRGKSNDIFKLLNPEDDYQ
ncbi:ATP-binding protein [Larkinella sp. C7]|uniref:ATP-binding protein n=1 Tax=Larkinella sp. C7 TaxID=2576607 RepID=UPI0011110542|nr:ATP-binding protein [Larkinella sp. C7]